MQTSVKEKLRAGQVVFGAFVSIPAPRVVELCGLAGFDYVVIDAEHGPIDVSMCEDLVRAADAAGLAAIVRVPGHDPKLILRFLDTGAHGVMVPGVNSVTEAKEAVEAVKYAPLGRRGLGPGRAAAYGQGGSMSEYARRANDETLIVYKGTINHPVSLLDEATGHFGVIRCIADHSTSVEHGGDDPSNYGPNLWSRDLPGESH